jgi:predicted Zn-dependent protease with MMP-like domain
MVQAPLVVPLHAAGGGDRHNVLVIDMPLAEFERAVGDALDDVPEELARRMSNVAVLVEDDPPDERDLLGLYEGVPLTERNEWWAAGSLPDRITIFRNPILRICDSRAEVVEQVRITVVHEIAHHFGIDDDRLSDLGWA